VLRRDDDAGDLLRSVAVVGDRDLGLAVGTEEVDLAGLAVWAKREGELVASTIGSGISSSDSSLA
jgi:hypothetical protein